MSLWIDQTSDLSIPHALRRAVFIDEQGIPEAEEWDDLDRGAVHLVAWDGDTAVGTVRLLIDADSGTGHITRVCVLASHRGTGAGARLIRAGVARLTHGGHPRIELSAQEHARDFYARLGFEPRGAPYDDAGIPHVRMVLRQPATTDAPAG